jgi:hypothetical protein
MSTEQVKSIITQQTGIGNSSLKDWNAFEHRNMGIIIPETKKIIL